MATQAILLTTTDHIYNSTNSIPNLYTQEVHDIPLRYTPDNTTTNNKLRLVKKNTVPIEINTTDNNLQLLSNNKQKAGSFEHITVDDPLECIPWYHPGMNKSMAIAFMKTHNLEGSYLLRNDYQHAENSAECQYYVLCVWSSGGCFDFSLKLFVNDRKIEFGKHYYAVDDFLNHFNNFPCIGSSADTQLILKHPLNNMIPEYTHYDVYKPNWVKGRDNIGNTLTLERQVSTELPKTGVYRAGFLTKRGHIVKNWKKRWFVLDRTTLTYYNQRPTGENEVMADQKSILKQLNLRELLVFHEIDHNYKHNFCFTLYFSKCKYSMYAENRKEYDLWVSAIKRAIK